MIQAVFVALLAVTPAATPVGAKSSATAMQSMNAIGGCLATEHTAATRSLLAMDFRDAAYGKAMRKLMQRPARCHHVEVFPGVHASGALLWGGALAEGLLRRDGTLPRLAEATALNSELPLVEARAPGELMALCVVRSNPAGVAELLESGPGSGEELAAFKGVGSTLSACVPANSKSEFTRESLRALLSLGAYRLAAHNAGGAGGSKEGTR